MNDWNDRLVDAALHEVHGSQPPDLSARVLAALQQGPAQPLPQLVPVPPPAPRTVPLLAALLLAALALGVAGALAWSAWSTPRALPVALASTVRIEVGAGRVECIEGGVSRVLRAGENTGAVPFAAVPGHRLRMPVASAFQLVPFGLLVAAPETELEVRAMEFTKSHGALAASSLTLAVVAGVVTSYALARTETATAGDVLRMQAGAPADVSALATENATLRQRVRELEQRTEELRTQAAVRENAPPAPTPTPPAVAAANDAKPATPATAAFTDAAFAEALAKINWAEMGAVSHEMGPLLAQLAAALQEEGAELPMELAIKIGQLNGKLVEQVPALLAAKMPGFGPNGSYTHPLVVANTLASVLAHAGQTLTPAQHQQIDGLVRAFSVESQSIADAQREFPLEQLLAETEMKDRFFREVGSLLAPEQHGAAYPRGATGYEGSSLFDTGVLLRPYAEPVAAKDAADFARIVTGKLGEQLDLDDATAAQVRAVIAQTSAQDELWRDRAAPIETSPAHFLRTGRTPTALRAQLAWMRAVARQVPLTDEQKRKLGKLSRVMVPLPR